MASYTDKGSKELPESSLSVRDQIVFKFPRYEGQNADEKSGGLSTWEVEGDQVVGSIKNDSYLKFNDIGLEGLKNIELFLYFGADHPYGGKVEIRENSPNGTLIGETSFTYFDKEKGAKKNYLVPVIPTKDFDALYLVFKGTGDKEDIIANFNAMQLKY